MIPKLETIQNTPDLSPNNPAYRQLLLLKYMNASGLSSKIFNHLSITHFRFHVNRALPSMSSLS
jgi:hypothetical protein